MTPEQKRRHTFQTFVRESEIKALEAQREYQAERIDFQFIVWTVLATVITLLIACGAQLINQLVGGAA